MDCTFCLDCVKACPHDNVGLIAVAPGRDLIADLPRSSVGRYAASRSRGAGPAARFRRLANAAGMVLPVLNWLERLAPGGDLLVVTGLALLALVFLPAACAGAAASVSSKFGRARLAGKTFRRFAYGPGPLDSACGWRILSSTFSRRLSPLSPSSIAAREVGSIASEPVWTVASWAFYDLPALELLRWISAFFSPSTSLGRREVAFPKRTLGTFLPWAILAALLFAAGVWIIFQPMENARRTPYALNPAARVKKDNFLSRGNDHREQRELCAK